MIERTSPLQVGLLLDSFIKPRWVYRIVAEIQNSPAAEIVLVIKDDTPPPKQSLLQKLWSRRRYWLYKAYTRLDHLLFKVEPDAFERVDLRPLLADCPTLPVRPIQKKFSDYFPPEAVAAIDAYQLDVALRFGFRILRGEALAIAKYGVWSYHHGDNRVNRGGPPGFWEVMEGQPVTGSILQILTEKLDGGRVIYRSYAPTHKRSVKRNKNNYYWKSTAFVPRKLEALHRDGPAVLADEPDYHPYSHPLYKNPTNLELLPHLLRFGGRVAMDKGRELLGSKQWFLAYGLGEGLAETFYRFKPMMPPRDRYWADPFPVQAGDKYFIFIEEYLYKTRQGHIALIEMDSSGHYGPPVTVLARPYHLSYPCVFQWRGNYYMIPETMENRTVELYRCVDFPARWEREAILMEGVRAVDATLAEIEGRWWMFVNIGVEGTANTHDELHLFYAETPLGPWRAYAHNPVKSDCRSARPAGRFFWWHGDLYRPAQDCSRNYGYAIVLNRITHLTPDRFQEEAVSRIWPRWRKNLVATHTLNSAAGLTIVDGMLQKFWARPEFWESAGGRGG